MTAVAVLLAVLVMALSVEAVRRLRDRRRRERSQPMTAADWAGAVPPGWAGDGDTA